MHILFLKWDDEYINTLKDFDKEIILLVDNYDIGIHEEKIKQNPIVYRVESTSNLQQIISASVAIKLKFDKKVSHVISFTDYSQYASALIASILGLSYPNLDLIIKTRDKRLIKYSISALGINTANFLSIPRPIDADAIRQFIKEIGFPIIVKPVDSTGAQGVKLIKNLTQLEEWEKQIISDSLKSMNYHFMAEQYIEGDEYHVDIVWYEGNPLYTFVGKNFVPLLDTVGNKLPNASIQLDYNSNKNLYDNLVSITVNSLKILGINCGFYSGTSMTE